MNEKNSFKSRPPFSGPFRFCKVGSPIRSEYRLSRPDVDGFRELVEVGSIDLREVVQSNYVNSFDAILDRFLDTGEVPYPRSFMSDYSSFMEEARERYQLPPEMSFSEIRGQLKNKLDEVNKTIKNGGIQNEKENQTPQNAQPPEVPPTVSEYCSND